METLRFKTTIKCSGCLGKVTPFINKAAGEDNWEVDIENPDKILTVVPETGITGNDIIKAVEEAGYKAEKID
ncbi:MAG TPA: heavy metal transport/detoxification protein [Ferruginibacter sp.]|mgnify:FL=1|jgi:copper chaperone CopZ|nr:heavy metal transport/detoxification protein [Ferruginibacter sp.]MBN8698659.1 heavy metal transport/detoxification protein [Chitinophagales bacterium]HMX36470.1 heavy metal transport/detoxification protein [Ferruginibacter sp.]HMX81479.1 heavy metal transport/detoxification protein [Ferruginibacter sp.]HNF44641.1 heavy metal transport/detoxification protein [Ferruginibacter sp.]